MSTFENKEVKKVKLDTELTLKVSKNENSKRIFVEYKSEDGKLVVQKSFQDTLSGNSQADTFQEKFKTITDLKKYLRLEK